VLPARKASIVVWANSTNETTPATFIAFDIAETLYPKALTDDEARTLSCPAARRTPAPRRLAEQAQALIATSPTCTSGALTDRCVRLVAM
jgi:hypothetical protein